MKKSYLCNVLQRDVDGAAGRAKLFSGAQKFTGCPERKKLGKY